MPRIGSRESRNRERPGWDAAAAALAVVFAVTATAGGGTSPARPHGGQAAPPVAREDPFTGQELAPPGARYDPNLTRLFTPSRVEPGQYAVFLTPAAIQQVASFYRSQPGAAQQDGAWRVTTSDAMQALGSSGPYDRMRVAQLYTGKPVSLARGSIRRQQGGMVSVSLLTPHPNASLSALESSTMVIVFRVGKDGRVVGSR